MSSNYLSPGVYREDIFLKPETKLHTGVPGFVGFATPGTQGMNAPAALHRKEEFADKFGKFDRLKDGFLAEAVAGFFDNGGLRCYVVSADPASNDRASALKDALATLEPFDDLDLLAIPDAMLLGSANDVESVQRAALDQCAKLGDRFAILDSLPTTNVADVLEQRNLLITGQVNPINGALYYPWINLAADAEVPFIPPCGHVAGIYARTDARSGVFKAPANEEVRGALDLGVNEEQKANEELKGIAIRVDNHIQEQLNPVGINCLRAFPGRGIRVWGARTLSGNEDGNEEWRYVNVRRLYLTMRRWIDLNMNWATFEPNEPRLWVRIRRELGGYLESLWRAGGLFGRTPDQAFYVKCDAETNPPERRELGEVVTEIGFAPSRPAEFIVVRIMHHMGTTEVS